jgi:hypothetical protein
LHEGKKQKKREEEKASTDYTDYGITQIRIERRRRERELHWSHRSAERQADAHA